MKSSIKQILKTLSIYGKRDEHFEVDVNSRPYRVVRKDGSTVIEFNDYGDAIEFSIKLNQLYIENNFKDKARVISVDNI